MLQTKSGQLIVFPMSNKIYIRKVRYKTISTIQTVYKVAKLKDLHLSILDIISDLFTF